MHPWEEGRRFVLGGVVIPHTQGLKGHSDGDVLTHALMDALLGALGMGDIGEYFPPSEEKFRDISSLLLLKEVKEKVKNRGAEILNIDAVVILEEPRIAPFREKIREKLSSILGIDRECINIKATTSETLGFVGRKEGVVSLVSVLLRLP